MRVNYYADWGIYQNKSRRGLRPRIFVGGVRLESYPNFWNPNSCHRNIEMIGHPSKDLSAIVYIWRFTTNSDRKSTKWWAIWFRSRLFGFVCHKSLIGHIRHQWPCHISRNFNKVFSWETTWTSQTPKNSSMQNRFEEVRPEVLSSCLSTRRSSFSNIFCFLGY